MLIQSLKFLSPRKTKRGGFTLVELLVVIGIIAILAGVALGPITRGIKQAKQSSGLQTARTIALAEFAFANDNNQTYPDANVPTSGGTADATCVAKALLGGNYISDASIFYLSGGTATKYTGTAAATAIAKTNISWDFTGLSTGAGLNANTPDQTPVVWSSVTGGTVPAYTANVAMTCVPTSGNPFGMDGVAVAFKNNGSKFVIYSTTASTCTLVDATYPGLTNGSVNPGGG